MSLDVSNSSYVSLNDTYKATAKVGKDTIENVEYFTFKHFASKKEKTFKDKLEDLWDTITRPYWRAKRRVKDAYWEVRYGLQRMFKGYDSVDVFDTYSKFVERYTNILARYRKVHVGYVYGMTNEEWEAIIDEMLYHLHYMDEQNVRKELEENVTDDWYASMEAVDRIMNKHKDEFFVLFSKYFYNLWD